MEGTVAESKKIIGTLSSGGSMVGGVGAVLAKDGDSAYQVAVKNGFEGTETEWLASLKGEKGEQGIQGVQGERGLQGEKGDRGEQGIQGVQGVQGEQGLKGDKGDKGDRGERGLQGVQGIQGAQGIRGLQGEKGEKGDKGDKGDKGNSGLYVGTGEMPEDYDAQLDPDGEAISVEGIIAAVCELTKPYIDKQLGVIENGSY